MARRNSTHSFALAALAVLAAISTTQAQEANSARDMRRPGIWHEGRFIGYQPAHEQLSVRQIPQPQSTAPSGRSATSFSARHDVQPAAFQEPAEELAPSREPRRAAAEVHCAADSSRAVGIGCCGNPSWWVRAEYLLWWTQGMNVPALATSGNAVDAVPGALDQAGTQILFGDTALNDETRSGGRFTLGMWFDACQCCGVEVSYLALGDEDTNFSASNNDFAVLGRPFFNTVTNAQDARLIADPGNVSGTLDIAVTTEFQSLEVLYRRAYMRSCNSGIDLLVGYRFAELEDRVRIGESTLALAGPAAGNTFDLFDQFDTRNTFHGAEFGLVMHSQANPCWSWEGVAKVAIGGSDYRAGVSGQTVTTDNLGNAATNQGGLLTQGTNIGSFRWDDFATVSEFGITLRRDLQCGLTANFGYSFLYWSKVARAGDQIDSTVNPTQIPPGVLAGEARPAFPFQTTDFWAQGLRFGLEYNF